MKTNYEIIRKESDTFALLKNGKELWSHYEEEGVFEIRIYDNKVIYEWMDGITILDFEEKELARIEGCNMLCLDDGFFCTSGTIIPGNILFRFSPDGKELWHCQVETQGIICKYKIFNDKIYILLQDGVYWWCHCLDSNGNKCWYIPIPSPSPDINFTDEEIIITFDSLKPLVYHQKYLKIKKEN